MTNTEPQELMEQALRETCQYSHQLAEACTKISADFRGVREAQVLRTLTQFLEGVGWISQAMHLTYQAQQENQLSLDLAELPRSLDPLVTALGDKDYNLISDILTFEIQLLLKKWTAELGTVGKLATDELTHH